MGSLEILLPSHVQPPYTSNYRYIEFLSVKKKRTKKKLKKFVIKIIVYRSAKRSA